MPSSQKNNLPFQSILTWAMLFFFPVLIWQSAHAGLGSWFSTAGVQANQLAAANDAAKFAPADPEVHFLRGAILEAGNDLPGAIGEFDRATSLRPDDYVLWLNLARVRESRGDAPGAIAAARQALPLAPFYAEPHWQLGNLLVRAGQTEEGLKELRLAGMSNPVLVPSTIDLAWQLSGGDARYVARVIAPAIPEAHLALGDYFKLRGQVVEAIASYGAAGPEGAGKRREYLAELIVAKKFGEAYRLWSIPSMADPAAAVGVVRDPGFEQEGDLDQTGFGWRRSNKSQTISLSLDSGAAQEGRASLLAEFRGESDPGPPIISQLVLVAPGSRYQLTFAARTEGIVSGGLPHVGISDANDNQQLGAPVSLPQQTGGWQQYSIDFETKDTTPAILISVSRTSCAKSPCPIFGRLWLDNLSLRKL